MDNNTYAMINDLVNTVTYLKTENATYVATYKSIIAVINGMQYDGDKVKAITAIIGEMGA